MMLLENRSFSVRMIHRYVHVPVWQLVIQHLGMSHYPARNRNADLTDHV